MEDGVVSRTMAGTPQGGVISPLLSNLYLHVLDLLWTRHSAPLGVLVRYADDFVIVCRSRQACLEARRRVQGILQRLGLELHPEKTRIAELYDGKEGFDFLGCHLRKRMSGKLWAEQGRRLYFLQRWPSDRSMGRIRQRIREADPAIPLSCGPPGGDCPAEPRAAGLGQLLPDGERGEALQSGGRLRLAPSRASSDRPQGATPEGGRGFALDAGVLLEPGPLSPAGDRSLPGAALLATGGRVMLRPERPPESRVREIRTHGLKGGLDFNARPMAAEE